jgi:hypothetical protein
MQYDWSGASMYIRLLCGYYSYDEWFLTSAIDFWSEFCSRYSELGAWVSAGPDPTFSFITIPRYLRLGLKLEGLITDAFHIIDSSKGSGPSWGHRSAWQVRGQEGIKQFGGNDVMHDNVACVYIWLDYLLITRAFGRSCRPGHKCNFRHNPRCEM